MAHKSPVSEMWPLLFLSGEFWQQTAVSRIPLHVVFVKLHASDVSRCITRSADPTMQQLEKQRMYMKFCFNLWKTFELLKQAYGAECMSRKQCYKWFKSFKDGRTSFKCFHKRFPKFEAEFHTHALFLKLLHSWVRWTCDVPAHIWGCSLTYTTCYPINTFKYHVFAPMGRFQLELIYLYFPRRPI